MAVFSESVKKAGSMANADGTDMTSGLSERGRTKEKSLGNSIRREGIAPILPPNKHGNGRAGLLVTEEGHKASPLGDLSQHTRIRRNNDSREKT